MTPTSMASRMNLILTPMAMARQMRKTTRPEARSKNA